MEDIKRDRLITEVIPISGNNKVELQPGEHYPIKSGYSQINVACPLDGSSAIFHHNGQDITQIFRRGETIQLSQEAPFIRLVRLGEYDAEFVNNSSKTIRIWYTLIMTKM